MKFPAFLMLSLTMLSGLGLTGCDSDTNPTANPAPTKTSGDTVKTTPTDTTKTNPTGTQWTVAVLVDQSSLSKALVGLTSSAQVTASQSAGIVATKTLNNFMESLSLSIPSGNSCTVTVNGYDTAGTLIWTGSATVQKFSPSTIVPLMSTGAAFIPDETPVVDQGGVLEAGAQLATSGSFISIQDLFVMTSGETTTEDQSLIDLVFFAMTGSVKNPAGTPSFVSPNLIKANLNWSKINKTIIVKTSKAAADFKTVQNIKDVIATAPTSEVAPAVKGGVYALLLSNGKYAVLSVTSLAGSGGSAEVSFRVIK